MAGKREDFLEEDFAEEDFDNDGFEDELEEERPHPLVTAGVFLGLVVLAAIICAILWNFTHRDNEDDVDVGATDTVQDESVEIDQPEREDLDSESEKNIEEEPEGEESTQTSESMASSEQDSAIGVESMNFTEISDTVTAKDVTNLRSAPSTADSENIVTQLLNGETLTRTGINDATGWSRLDYNGQAVYAVSAYLTTDLAYEIPADPSDSNRITTKDDRVVIFEDCDDYVMPKEYVNLRIEPSTSQGNATINCQIRYGETVHRTGYSEDSGWSRVEYNGLTLYVVSSMVYSVETTE